MNEIIKPQDIGFIDPYEDIVGDEEKIGGKYYSPKSRFNPKPGYHIVEVNEVKVPILEQSILNIMERLENPNARNLAEKATERLDDIANTIYDSPNFKQDFEKLIHAHEHQHHAQEIRFGIENLNNRLDAFYDYVEETNLEASDNERRDLSNAGEECERIDVVVEAYMESNSVIASLRETKDIDLSTKSKIFFLSATSLLSNVAHEIEDFSQREYNTLIDDDPFFSNSHILTYIMIATGNMNLVEETYRGTITQEEFTEQVNAGFERIFTEPERIIEEAIENDNLLRNSDMHLMSCLNTYKDKISEAESKIK